VKPEQLPLSAWCGGETCIYITVGHAYRLAFGFWPGEGIKATQSGAMQMETYLWAGPFGE
jgi:hypothetical protein